MIKLEIDNKTIEVAEGIRLIEAARANGIGIPSLCYSSDLPHYTSCSVCLVKNIETNKFIHACSAIVAENMKIDASGIEVQELRKEAVSMLLAEHRAECEAPCKAVCPMGLNIPLMNRFIQKSDFQSAANLAYAEMGMPETLCALCPAYCENACRRKMIDHSIAILAVKTYSSNSLNKEELTFQATTNGKRIAIVGGNLDGLIAAFFLAKQGHQCTLFEKTNRLGDSKVTENEKISAYFQNELKNVLQNINVVYGQNIDENLISESLSKNFDTFLIASSNFDFNSNAIISDSDLICENDSLTINSIPVFKIGKAAQKNSQIIRNIAQAKKAAIAINHFLKTGIKIQKSKEFNSTIGKIEEIDKKAWLQETPVNSERFSSPSSDNDCIKEAENCMHCDCRASENCELRSIASDYQLSNPKNKSTFYPIEKKINESNGLIFEHAKCIKCGLCVRLLQKEADFQFLGFQGRGFRSIISQPLTHQFNDIISKNINKLVDICPTAALSLREK